MTLFARPRCYIPMADKGIEGLRFWRMFDLSNFTFFGAES